MQLYSRTHDASCGIDLHARTMYICVLDREGKTLLHRNLPTRSEALLSALTPFRSTDLVVGCECLFACYELADTCEQDGMPFALGHALGMRAIHGLKIKSDTSSTPGRSPSSCAAGTSPAPTSTRGAFAPRAISYARLIKPRSESAGKLGGWSGRKQGNVHLKWGDGLIFTSSRIVRLKASWSQVKHSPMLATLQLLVDTLFQTSWHFRR